MRAQRRFRSACDFAVWSESLLAIFWNAKYSKFLYKDIEDWLLIDYTDAQADLSP